MDTTLIFSLMLFMPGGNTQVMSTFPTQESCVTQATRVAGELKHLGSAHSVGVACVPTNQWHLDHVQAQMNQLMTVMRDFTTEEGRVNDCAR